MNARRAVWALLTLVSAMLSTAVHSACYEPNFPLACTTVDGCPGIRACLGGYPTQCIKFNPACPAPPPPSDVFIGLNAPAAQVGILVDGLQGNAEVDDRTFVVQPSGATARRALGQMEPSALDNEVLSFAATRAPTRHATPWTAGLDSFQEPLENTLRVPITVWILTPPGSFGAQAMQALSVVIQAGALFDQERLGLDFNAIALRDETGNPRRGDFLNVTGLGALESQIGHVPAQFNVYWVEAVSGGSGSGIGEVAHGDSVAIGMNSPPGLLAHELGHNLALDHIDGDPRFDGSNIMMSAGGSRLFVTEGQAYRAHIRTISAIRSTQVYGLRPGMPLIDTCNLGSTTRECPRPDKRIWADGLAFPPN